MLSRSMTTSEDNSVEIINHRPANTTVFVEVIKRLDLSFSLYLKAGRREGILADVGFIKSDTVLNLVLLHGGLSAGIGQKTSLN